MSLHTAMRSTERRPLALEKQHPGEDRVLYLLAEFVELQLELVGEGNGPGHSVLMSWKLYSFKALILQ